MGSATPVADWREAAAYAPLLAADRSIFAWEWLRRNPAYRPAAESAPADVAAAELLGLHRFEDPARAAPDARPLWRADHHAGVLRARAQQARSPVDALDLGRLAADAELVAARDGTEHWLFSDGLRAVRLDIVGRSGTRGAIELHYLLFGRASLQGPLLALRRLLALAGSGRFARTLHAPERLARRWILALRAYDAIAEGISQREIAAELLAGRAAAVRWRVEASSIRSQVQRLVRTARIMAQGGYRRLLE